MNCRFHPEKRAVAICEKFKVGYCSECCESDLPEEGCRCLSPDQHCRFRSQCIVWELSKDKRKQARGV